MTYELDPNSERLKEIQKVYDLLAEACKPYADYFEALEMIEEYEELQKRKERPITRITDNTRPLKYDDVIKPE